VTHTLAAFWKRGDATGELGLANVERTHLSHRPRSLVIAVAWQAAIAMLSGCASTPTEMRFNTVPPTTLVTTRAAGVSDLRGAYRIEVCRRLPAEAACDDVLLRLAGEPKAASVPPANDLSKRYRIAFVPGIFSECFERFARPFADVQRDLVASGFTVDYFGVPGRGSSTQNAVRLAEHFRGLDGDARPVILFAYSKGLVDVLEFMVRYPDEARRIAAVVAVAGAANGSPLADQLHGVYRDWGATFPLSGCADGTGDEIDDLRPDVRMAWWQKHSDALTAPLFALVAAPRPDRVSPVTRTTYRQLAQIDPRNDGKLLWRDQIPPRSHLLGYANADHWAIAVPVAKELPQVSFLFRDDVPRTAFVEGAIEVVARTLAEHPAN
jgi:hypothetical protein